MNQILRAALELGDTSLIATGVLAHPRSHQLQQSAADEFFKLASREIEPTPANSQRVRTVARSFLIFDGEVA